MQDDSAESKLEMMNNAQSPTSSIHQQNDELINEKKKEKPAMKRLKEQAKRRQKKNKSKQQKPKEQQNLSLIIKIDIDEDEIKPTPTINNSYIKQESKIGEEMSESEREELPNAEEKQNQEEVVRQEEMRMHLNTIQDEGRITRRGERQRHKTDFYGQNVMVTRIENP